ncbi:MAG TPA: response regulator [Bacillota bacterium]|nr:response regulator [Bacillota bacterium]HPT86787.1 response regulator [Bacillota bacterium]
MGKVLIIDDEPDITTVLQAALEMEGHQVQTANSGMYGLVLLEEGFQPDVVLLDLNMPGMGGTVFLEEADSRGYGRFPVIWLTGAVSGSSDMICDGRYQRVIAKPFDLIALLETVDQMLETATSQSLP